MSIEQSQSGKSLGKHHLEPHAAVSYGNYRNYSDAEYIFDFPLLQVGAQYGVHEKMDVGVSLNYTMVLTGMWKYQVLGNQESKFAGSIGLTGGFNAGSWILGDFQSHFSVPVHLSYHPTDKLFFYATPRFLYANNSEYYREFGSPRGHYYNASLFGASAGVCYGDQHKVFLGISSMDGELSEPTLFTVGYRLNLDLESKWND